MGAFTKSRSYIETVLGQSNTDYAPSSITFWNATDRLFVVGNGFDIDNRSDALRMLKNGNTAIGNMDPTAKLDIDGQLRMRGGAPGAGKVLTSDANGLAAWETPVSGLPTGTDNQTLRHDGTTWAASSALVNTGFNVGIGTAEPARKLVVHDGDRTLRLSSSTSSAVHLELFRQGSGSLDYRISNLGGVLLFGRSSDDFETVSDIMQMTALAFRSVPDNTMSLGQSSARFTTVFATNGTINTSDARDKERVEDLSYGLETLLKLRPVSFEWKENKDHGTKLGLIAQELQQVIPEVVHDWDYQETEEGGVQKVQAERLGVYYSDLIPVLIKGVQEMDAKVEAVSTEGMVSREEFEALKAEKDAQIAAQQRQIETILARLNDFDTDLQQCCFDHSDGTRDEGRGASVPADAPALEQNQPNPFQENTVIRCYLPTGTRTASIIVSDLNGVQLKAFDLGGTRGAGQVLISGGAFAAGTYLYTLTVDGQRIDTKRMVML